MELGHCVVCGKQLEITRYYDKNGKFKGYGQSFKKVTCSRACTNVYRAGIDMAERFWSKVDKRGSDDCWLWTASVVSGKQPYGRMQWTDGLELAHRIAWSLANNQPLPDEDVLHTCDNPRCCNPQHLFLGTHDDNMYDMVTKGRASRKYGMANGRAVLTTEEVQEIKEAYASKEFTQMDLAAVFNVSQGTISDIVLGKNRVHG